jgi:tetratricopeptide (TPR) repeat protein
VAKALKPDGIFSMWFAVGDMSETGIQTILSALHQSFSYCELRLLRSSYYLLTCSNRPVSPRQFAELPIHQDLANLLQSGLPGLDLGEFFDDIRLSANIFDHFQPTVAEENTDDHPVLEFMVTRHFQMKRMGGDPFIKQQALFNIDPIRGHQLGNPIRFAHRAAVFHRLGSEEGGYLDNFNPVLMKDATIASEFFWKIAEFRRHEGQLDKASSLLATALNIRPGFAKAHNSLGSMLVSEGQLEKAIRHFTLALQSKPNFTQAYCNLGNTLALQGKHDKAIQTFKNAIEYNKQSNSMSDMASIHFSLGRILKKTNKTQEADQEFTAAVEEYRKKIAKNPESTKTLVQMGDVLVELGNLPQATEYFQQAVDMNPYDTNNQSALVQTLVSQERYDEAIVALKRAVSYTSYVGADKEAASEFERQTEFLKHKKKE